MNIIKYNTVIVDNYKCSLEECVDYCDYEFVKLPFKATVKIENCGKIIDNEIHIDINALKEHSNILYRTCRENEIIASKNNFNWPEDFDFDKASFLIEIDDMAQVYYPITEHEQVANIQFVATSYNEYLIKRLVE